MVCVQVLLNLLAFTIVASVQPNPLQVGLPIQITVNCTRDNKGELITKVELNQGVPEHTVPGTEHLTTAVCEGGQIVHIMTTLSVPYSAPTPAPISVPPKVKTPTGSGYEFFPGLGFYKFHARGETWPRAKQLCAEESTHLIIINSRTEAEVVKTLFTRYMAIPGAEQTGWVWTGVYEREQHGAYYTLNGDPLNATGFMTWSATEPNDGGNDDCVLTNRIDAFLADAACTRLFGFICELEI